MGILDRVLGREKRAARGQPWFDLPKSGSLEVANGPSHGLHLLSLFSPGPEPQVVECTAHLVREPTDSHDQDAVAVYLDGHHVGYVPPKSAASWSRYLSAVEAEGRRVRCAARVRHRWDLSEHDRPRFEIHLRLAETARGYRTPSQQAAVEAERRRLATERAAKRERAARERKERAAAWRRTGLCPGCGAEPVHASGSRGPRRVWCASCRPTRAIPAGHGRTGS